MYVLLVNKDGSHINKSDIPLLSAFLDLIKLFHGKTGLIWCHLRFFELPIFRTNVHFPWRFEKSEFHCNYFVLARQGFISKKVNIKGHSQCKPLYQTCATLPLHVFSKLFLCFCCKPCGFCNSEVCPNWFNWTGSCVREKLTVSSFDMFQASVWLTIGQSWWKKSGRHPGLSTIRANSPEERLKRVAAKKGTAAEKLRQLWSTELLVSI